MGKVGGAPALGIEQSGAGVCASVGQPKYHQGAIPRQLDSALNLFYWDSSGVSGDKKVSHVQETRKLKSSLTQAGKPPEPESVGAGV